MESQLYYTNDYGIAESQMVSFGRNLQKSSSTKPCPT